MMGIGKVGKEGWWNGVRGGEREREKERERDWDGERENTAKEILLLRSQGGSQGGGDARGIPLFQRSYLYNLDCVV